MITKQHVLHLQKLFLTAMVCVFMLPEISYAQRHSVENLSFEVMQNDVIIIHYDLLSDGRNRKYNLNLTLRQESNRFFSYTPQKVIGDIGKGRFEGANNKIVWSLHHEPPGDFQPSPFIDDYYFTLEARRRSRAGWFFFFSILGGAAYYYFEHY